MRSGLAFLLLLAMSTGVPAAELNWLTNYSDALELARTEARPLLLVISQEDHLPASINPASSAQATQPSHDLLAAYVLCKIDPSSGYGKLVAEAYRVTEFPHSVIIDKTTKKILYSDAGRATDDTWKAALTKYQSPTTYESPATYQSPATYPRAATFRPVSEPQRQRAFRSSSRVYGRPYNFRAPVVCNT